MAVGSVNSLGEVSDASAQGDKLEIVAPGEQVMSTGAFDGIAVLDGTSMAAPHVSGVASVLWQKDNTTINSGISGMEDHPQFHRYYINNNNYLASYIYLTMVANKYGDTTSYSYMPSGMNILPLRLTMLVTPVFHL